MSYPGAGTTWTDLVCKSKYNGTLVNTPTFVSDNNGKWNLSLTI